MGAVLLMALAAAGCLLPSFDDLGCDGSCGGSGSGGSGNGGSASAPCGVDGVLIDGPGDTPYCIGKTEVTLLRYCEFLDAVVDEVELERPAVCDWETFEELTECLVTDDDICAAINQTCNDPGHENGHLPAVGMDWCGAAMFCLWDGKRLCGRVGGGHDDDPLRSEWVGACKPTTETPECSDSGCVDYLDTEGAGSTCEGGVEGLFNMVGNVSEWVDNCEGTSGVSDYCEPRGGDCFEGPAEATCSTVSAPRPRRGEGASLGLRCCWDP